MNEEQPSIAALASMFFGAKLKGEVERSGYVYLGAIGATGLLKHARDSSPVAIFLDLGKDDVDYASLVTTLRSDQVTESIPIVAFCGHVDTEKLAAAKDWGCDVVTTNGAVSGSFETVLRSAIGS
jgi:PleD family two-component response regulator